MTDTENFDFTPSWDFYDLQNDPHENHNAYNDPKYAPVIKQMKKDLLRLRKKPEIRTRNIRKCRNCLKNTIISK